ncbi:DEAD/DEAH box helicase [Desulfococcaceae bacterium HSG8]|nr:DEAD/DEAH box helicase [Desulfococcaceae bacterium HSG8]
MSEDTFDIFEKLKRKKPGIRQHKITSAVFFQLVFDENGAYIRVIDEKQREIDPDYEYASGHTRNVLKFIEEVKARNSFRIDWESPNDRIYLAENEYLIWQLQYCDNFVDTELNPICFAEGTAKIVVRIEDKKKFSETKILLSYKGEQFEKISFLHERHAFAQGKIYRIQPLSSNFKDIRIFETALLPTHLEKYLSLLFSSFRNISVRYQDYRIAEGSPAHTRPTMIIEKVDELNTLHLRISRALPGFDADFLENYDITRIASLNDLDKKIVVSDVIHEDSRSCFSEIEKLLKKHKKSLEHSNNYFEFDNVFVIDENLAKEFIQKELPHLITRFTILGAEKLKTYKVRAVKPRLTLNLSHGIDFLEGDASLDIEGQSISLFDALNQYRKDSYISLNDGTHAIISKNYMNKLNRIFKKHRENVRLSLFDLPIIEELIDEKIAQESFIRSREIFSGFNNISKSKPAFPKLNAELRRYQKQGYKWLRYLHKHSLGGCLADDMGLGKTLQAISLLASVCPEKKIPSLIIVPKSLLFNWENEITKFRPDLSYYTYHGMNRDPGEASQNHLILTTYAMIRNDIEKLKDQEFYYVILDESQLIKNPHSQTSRAVMLLKTRHRLALSGTPIENNLGELYSLFRFLNPSMFGSADDFNRNYAIPIQKEDDKDALRELRKKIYPFILRRLKKDVLKDLPDKIEQTLYIEMTPDQKLFYEQRRRFYYETVKSQIAKNGMGKSRFFILQALSELRQIASVPESRSENEITSPKREVLMDNISEVVANNHKVLVFANFLNALDCIGEDLDNTGIDFLIMTGATRDRRTLVEKFQNDDTYKVFLMTLKTGGLGLNLTAADYIFIFDPWWNISAENQAIDRTHRIGQDKTVFSYKLITRGTIEEKILELQKRKSELFDSLISSDGASIKSLDEKDVEFMLGF